MNAVHTATRKTTSIMALGALALTLSLAACGDKTETAKAGTAATSATANIDEKYNAYVSGFNRLQTNQTQKNAEDWARINVAKNDMKNNIYFFNNDNQVVQAVDSLKAGRAMKVDGTEAADRAADKLIENGDALAAQLREMNPYFKSAAYRDDKLAKAIAADAPMRAAYTGVLQGMEEMEAALGAHQKKRDAERAEAYKKAGNMTGYHLTIATLRGSDLVDAASDSDFAQADKLVAEIDASLAALRTEQAKLKGPQATSLGSITDQLNNMLGSYRSFKQRKEPRDFDQMVRAYNSAITYSNAGQ